MTGEINRPLFPLITNHRYNNSINRSIQDRMIFKEVPSLMTFLTFNQVGSTGNLIHYGVNTSVSYSATSINTTWFNHNNQLQSALVRKIYFKDYGIESQLSIYRTLGQRTQGFFSASVGDGETVRFILDNGSFIFSGLWDNLEPGKLYTINPNNGALEKTTDANRVYGYALTSSILSKVRY